MKLSTRDHGYVILDEGKIPEELAHEIRHYNGLIKTSSQSASQKSAITSSENKIRKILQKHKGIYPIHVIYGHIPLIKLLMGNQTIPSELIQKLKEVKQDLGEEYFKRLLLFEPMLTLIDDNSPQMNIFMLAVKKGDVQLVKSILSLVEDVEFKKEMLQQCLQYWDGENQLIFKPILDLAIDSVSAELVDFLM